MMLRLNGVRKYFGRGTINEVLALDGVNLDIEKGEFVCVIGSNGAGKSTLMNSIAGTFFPDEGSIVLQDSDITHWPEHKRAKFIGRVFQDPLSGTSANMTIEENMAIAMLRGKRRGLGRGVKPANRELFQERLKKLELGLENRLHDRVGLLSGGQRQALTMLMATLVRPDILLLDEHTAALDPKTAELILSLTRELVEELSLTTLMITHNMHHALAFGSRVIMMHRGRVIFDVRGEKVKSLTVDTLLESFHSVGIAEFSDRMLLV